MDSGAHTDSEKRKKAAKQKRSIFKGKLHGRSRVVGFWMVFALILVAVFACGFLFRSNVPMMVSLGIPVAEPYDSSAASGASKTVNTFETLSERISEVEDLLYSYSMDDVPLDAATSGMIESLMKSTDDPYAEYFTEERYLTYVKENSLKEDSGIGVLFADYDGRAYAIDVLPDSEAQAEGVMQGDFVVAIDGDRSHMWSAAEVISELASSNGESIVITWMRPAALDAASGDEFTTTLLCSDYTGTNVDFELDEGVGYIKVRQFTSNSASLVSAAVSSLVEDGARAFVIDITDNPGGFLTQALEMASLFVQNGVLVSIETNDGVSTRNASGVTLTSLPAAVVINRYTTGTAEVFAAALKDNQRATLVGQTTMGKGSVQVTRELSFGGAIRYTAAYYLTPLGQPINGVGVHPNVEVQSNSQEDNVSHSIEVAMDIARSQIS